MENSELITKALAYIRADAADSGMTIDDVAEHAGFSTDYFNRIFFEHTGFRVMEYVRLTRLKKAARLLRGSDRDVLGISLDCGYESPESLCRAFRKQYGMSPSEYRKKYEKTEAHYGDFFNDTVAARLTHEFPAFRSVDPEDAVDWMVETDPLKYAKAAVDCHNDGGAALCGGELSDGFVLFTEWDGQFIGDIIADDWDRIAGFLKTFCGERFEMNLYTLADEETIISELSARGVAVKEIESTEIRACTSEPDVPAPPEGIALRELRYEDYPLIERHYAGRESWKYRLVHLKQELYQRYELGNEAHSVFCFGLFCGERMIGFAEGRLQRAGGLIVNNEIAVMPDAEYRTEEVYRYAFAAITKEALSRGALPLDTLHTSTSPREHGRFDSAEFGYRTVSNSCRIACG